MTKTSFQHCCSYAALIALATTALPRSSEARELRELKVFPRNVTLETKNDRQSILVQAVYDDGITEDVSTAAVLQIIDGKLAKIEKQIVWPLADGSSKLQIKYAGLTRDIPLTIKQSAVRPPVSFKLDVMPIFMKSGCNTGSCHGSSRGKDKFRLSIFGFDPDGDHHRLTREIPGRRINFALPEASMVLEKGIGAVQHSGGERFPKDSELYSTLLRWIEAGSPLDPEDIAVPTGVELYPEGAVLNGPGATQNLSVRASYSDGTTRDVTSLAFFMVNNENSAKITQEGVVTAAARGEVFIMARFAEFTVGVPFIVLPKDLEFSFPTVPENNYIDRLIHAKLRKLRMAPSEVCSDSVFLRRVHLDITGTLPDADAYQKFMADADPKKRAKLIDDLLERKEFVELWVMKWAELLQIRSSRRVSYKPMLLYYNWLQEKLSNDVPINQMVQELLSAQGGTFKSPATNYYQNETDTLKIAENVAQVFMGTRIQCAQCHNHPFDRWTQDEYYGFAAFFSQIGRKRAEDPREQIVFNRSSGEVKHPVGKRVMPPKFLGGAFPDTKGKDRRAVLAEWLTADDNPFFSRNLANIIWAHFFGRGIIDEVDDVRVSNPPSNGALIAMLGSKVVEYRYDFKKVVRDICNSRTYQLTTQTNESNAQDLTNFSHAQVRRIRAEVLLDCLSTVTRTNNKFRGLPLGSRAVQIADGSTSNYFLATFGRASRATVCSCEVKMEPNLSQALHMINGDAVSRKLKQGKLIQTRLKEGRKPEQIIEEIYLHALSRKPTETEWKKFREVLAADAKSALALEDIFWSVLNSREFLFNH